MAAQINLKIQSFSGVCSLKNIDATIASVTEKADTFINTYKGAGATFAMRASLVPVSKYGEKLCFVITVLIAGTPV